MAIQGSRTSSHPGNFHRAILCLIRLFLSNIQVQQSDVAGIGAHESSTAFTAIGCFCMSLTSPGRRVCTRRDGDDGLQGNESLGTAGRRTDMGWEERWQRDPEIAG